MYERVNEKLYVWSFKWNKALLNKYNHNTKLFSLQKGIFFRQRSDGRERGWHWRSDLMNIISHILPSLKKLPLYLQDN
jgi:hypothetical protein